MARAKKPTGTPEANEAAHAAQVIAETSAIIMSAAGGRMVTNEQSEKVQPTINALWAAGGQVRDLILRVADEVARECGEDAKLKNNALSILRVRANRAQKEAGDPLQGIVLRTGVAQWGEPKMPKVRDYLGEALKLLAQGAEAGQVPADRLERAAQVLLGTVPQANTKTARPTAQVDEETAPVQAEKPKLSLLQRLKLAA